MTAAIALQQSRSEWLSRIRTIGLGLGGRGVLGLGLGRSGVSAAAVHPTNYFLQSYTGTRNNYAGTIGFSFTVGAAPITVVALGRSISTAITTNHRVGIWINVNVLLCSVTVSAASPVDLLGYAYELLSSSVTLSASTTYVIGSEEFNGGDKWRDIGSISNHLATASIVTGSYSLGPGFGFPGATYGTADTGYIPPTWFTQ